jgi:hypothetical protein
VAPFVEATYLNTRVRPNEEIDTRSRWKSWSGEGGVGIGLWPKIWAQLSGRRTETTWDVNAVFDDFFLARELDRTSTAYIGSLRYAATPLTTVFVSGDVEETRFTHALVRDADSRRILTGVELAPRALISGSARIGHQRFRPLSPLVPRYSGLVGSGEVSYRLPGATTMGFSYDRNVTFSYSEAEPYYLRKAVGLWVRRRLAERWDAEVGGVRAWSDYRQRGLEVLTETVVARSERFLDGTAAVAYQARPQTRVRVAVSYHDRRSDDTARNYDNLRLGTTLTYGF